jgi:hypothetical protein
MRTLVCSRAQVEGNVVMVEGTHPPPPINEHAHDLENFPSVTLSEEGTHTVTLHAPETPAPQNPEGLARAASDIARDIWHIMHPFIVIEEE